MLNFQFVNWECLKCLLSTISHKCSAKINLNISLSVSWILCSMMTVAPMSKKTFLVFLYYHQFLFCLFERLWTQWPDRLWSINLNVFEIQIMFSFLLILTFCHYRGCGGKLTNRPNRILLICSNFGKGEKIFWLNMKFVAWFSSWQLCKGWWRLRIYTNKIRFASKSPRNSTLLCLTLVIVNNLNGHMGRKNIQLKNKMRK